MTASPLRESRLPVGSSARRMAGLPARARATATRCCWPPESWLGRCLARWRHADALERFVHEGFAFARGHPAIGQRQLDVLVNGQVADEIEALENEADLAIADAGALREGEVRDLTALERVAAVRWRVEQAEDREQGRLSTTGRAGDGDVFAAANIEVNARERVGFDLIREEDFGDAVEVNQGVVSVVHNGLVRWRRGELLGMSTVARSRSIQADAIV